ncbi:MAG: hypothetical protein ABSB74_08910 [Tepidisphaeraceae bacterium]
MKKMKKPYPEMNAQELAEATKAFDEPFVMDRGRPLNAAERERHRRAAKRGRGRPRVGKGSERINITIERGLLAEADALGRREKIGRSELIARSLRLLVRKAG